MLTLEDQIKNNANKEKDNLNIMDSININAMNNMNNDNIIKEKEEKINNLNKTIDSLSKENKELKLRLLKSTDLQNKIDELNKIIKEQKEKYDDLNKQLEEQKYKNDMLNVEMQLNEKVNQRETRGKFKESGINLLINDNIKESKNIFNNSDDENIEILKKKNEDLENELMNLRKELELKEIDDKNVVSKDELEKVQNENFLLQSELEEEKEKNSKASQEIINLKKSIRLSSGSEKDNEKIKKYNIILSYMKQVINLWNPAEEKEKYILNKLRDIIEKDEK